MIRAITSAGAGVVVCAGVAVVATGVIQVDARICFIGEIGAVRTR
jgi:hypothetical protein